MNTKYDTQIAEALTKFEQVMRSQLERNERICAEKDFIDYSKLDKLIIGVCGGDGIGPMITDSAQQVSIQYVGKHWLKTARRRARRSPTMSWNS